MANQKRKSDCPVNFALELFGDRWTFLIVRDMMFKGRHYYGEFLQAEEKIATNILADRLALLEQAQIVMRVSDESHKQKIIYRLTKKGIDLLPVLVDMIMWSARYDKNSAADAGFIKAVKKDRDGLLKEITTRLIAELP